MVIVIDAIDAIVGIVQGYFSPFPFVRGEQVRLKRFPVIDGLVHSLGTKSGIYPSIQFGRAAGKKIKVVGGMGNVGSLFTRLQVARALCRPLLRHWVIVIPGLL